VVEEYGLWESIGCYSEGQGGRTLPFGVNSAPFGGADNMTVENCLDACLANGYPNAGIEYAVECCMSIRSRLRLIPSNQNLQTVAPRSCSAVLLRPTPRAMQ